MNFPISQIRRQWTRVVEHGWLPHFQEAAKKFDFDVADLIAIGSRESNLDPRYLREAGDRGNGFGLMQVDKRYFPQWVQSGKWKDARECILKGAEVLAMKRDAIMERQGQRVIVWNRAHTLFRKFVMPAFDEATLRQVYIASYNCGDWASYHASKGNSIDQGTTGADYSADVCERAGKFARFIETEKSIAPKVAAVSPETASPAEEKDTPESAVTDQAAAPASEATPPVEASELVSSATPVPGLKDCIKSFGAKLFGTWRKVTSWIAGVGISFDAGMLKPTIVALILIVLVVWLIIHTYKAKKKAKNQ
jgi:hypothetical protein